MRRSAERQFFCKFLFGAIGEYQGLAGRKKFSRVFLLCPVAINADGVEERTVADWFLPRRNLNTNFDFQKEQCAILSDADDMSGLGRLSGRAARRALLKLPGKRRVRRAAVLLGT
jgi:hypothetical protein